MKEQRQFSRKLKWKSKGDLKLNSDIQERAPKLELALLIIYYAALVFT